MRYLITCKGHEPFFTEWFDAYNNFNAELDMVVYDYVKVAYTTNGVE